MFDPNQCEYFARRQEETASSEVKSNRPFYSKTKLIFAIHFSQWIDSSYMASVNTRARRVKQWWNETVDYLRSTGVRGRSDSEKRTCEIFHDIKANKIQPLKLTRLDSADDNPVLLSPRRNKSNRPIYPLAKNYIEFEAIRTWDSDSRWRLQACFHEV